MSNEEIRAAAVKRINQKRGFWRMVGGFVIVCLILTGVWALSGGGYFWPMWAFFGMGIATAFSGWAVYGPRDRPISDQEIADEMRKMGGQ